MNSKIELIEKPATIEAPNQQPRNDLYDHYAFNESTNPELVEVALRVHAEGYTAMGIVSSDVLEPEGKFGEKVDHARGDNVDYFLLVDPKNPSYMATVRKINLKPGEKTKDLPGIKLTKNSIHKDGIDYLNLIEESNYQIKELSGFSRSRYASPSMAYELLRDVLHGGLNKNEAWFLCILSNTLKSLTRYFGESAFKLLGDETNINDEWVNQSMKFIPTVLFPDKFLSSLVFDIDRAENTLDKRKLQGMFMYASEGLSREDMDSTSYEYRAHLLEFLNQEQ